jgi:hypothetical protein
VRGTSRAIVNADHFNVRPFKVCAVLLTFKDALDGYPASTPIAIKTPAGLALVAFASQEVGAHYLRAMGMEQNRFSFSELGAQLPSVRYFGIEATQLLQFRSESDVDLFMSDRSRFPYSEFQMQRDIKSE